MLKNGQIFLGCSNSYMLKKSGNAIICHERTLDTRLKNVELGNQLFEPKNFVKAKVDVN